VLVATNSDSVAFAESKTGKFNSLGRSDAGGLDGDMDEMRIRLSRHIAHIAKGGERDLWRLANSAIGQLRRERSAA
jgi:hypothetical protein